jgi:hypothetical protein
VPFETPVQKPDFGILPLQVGLALVLVQIHKAHLPDELSVSITLRILTILAAKKTSRSHLHVALNLRQTYVTSSKDLFPSNILLLRNSLSKPDSNITTGLVLNSFTL